MLNFNVITDSKPTKRRTHAMIKGKRVFLDDLVEEYPTREKRYYATYHNDRIMNGPFTVIVAGKQRHYVRNEDGRAELHFNGDSGLIPYNGTNWNKSNATFEMLPEPIWQDDWF